MFFKSKIQKEVVYPTEWTDCFAFFPARVKDVNGKNGFIWLDTYQFQLLSENKLARRLVGSTHVSEFDIDMSW